MGVSGQKHGSVPSRLWIPSNRGLEQPADGSSNLPRATKAGTRKRRYTIRLREDALSEGFRQGSQFPLFPLRCFDAVWLAGTVRLSFFSENPSGIKSSSTNECFNDLPIC